MNCWICGAPADSKEHRIKASDVRRFFGGVSRTTPIYFQGGARPNIPVGSAKSNRLKTRNVICVRCNDTKTAAFDRAWEAMSTYVLDNWSDIKRRKSLKLQRVFPGRTKEQAINVQLFFAKLFGCRIVDERIPIPLTAFEKAVRAGTPHPNLYLTLTVATFDSRLSEYAAQSEVHAVKRGGACVRAAWYYTLGEFSVKVTWTDSTFQERSRIAWHPSRHAKIIKFETL